MSEQEAKVTKRQPNDYRVFSHVEDETWESLGVVSATGVGNARRAAIREFDLEEDVRNGTLELAVVANRFWRPVRSRITTSEKIEFE